MLRYSEFRPTGFDSKGAFLDDRQDWYVCPCSRTRDSQTLEESNFHAALEMLGGESEFVEVHRFGHWGPGWFEIILVSPDNENKVAILSEIEKSLENYPVLDDEDHSRREFEWSMEYLRDQAGHWIDNSFSEFDWVSSVWRKLWNTCPPYNDGNGDYWSNNEVKMVLKELGYYDRTDLKDIESILVSSMDSLSCEEAMQLETALEQFPKLRDALNNFMEYMEADNV